MCRFKPNHGLAGNRGQSPGLGTSTIHTVLLPRSSPNAPQCNSTNGPSQRHTASHACEATAKQHSLGAPAVHATHRAVTPTYCTGYLLLHRKQPHYIFVTNSLVNFHRDRVWRPGSRWSPTLFVEWSSTNCLFEKSESYDCPIIKVERPGGEMKSKMISFT